MRRARRIALIRYQVCMLMLLLPGLLWASRPSVDEAEVFASRRAAMLATIDRGVRQTSRELGRDHLRPDVRAALAAVPRHEFVPKELRRRAYFNEPLPIGLGQTISQPYIVAIMTELLELSAGDRVLEVGTGSGYQAAILGKLVERVYSIEIVPGLAERAGEVLARLGFNNVVVRLGDGYYGWPEEGPFDGIIVTAAASHVPPPLVRQLKPGARMIIPVGSAFFVQQLVLIEKTTDGEVSSEMIMPVRFVPLTGGPSRPD